MHDNRSPESGVASPVDVVLIDETQSASIAHHDDVGSDWENTQYPLLPSPHTPRSTSTVITINAHSKCARGPRSPASFHTAASSISDGFFSLALTLFPITLQLQIVSLAVGSAAMISPPYGMILKGSERLPHCSKSHPLPDSEEQCKIFAVAELGGALFSVLPMTWVTLHS